MPATTRSSAPSTPLSKQPVSSSAPQSTPRQPPRCKKCHQPRKGHPRQGCNVDALEEDSSSSSNDAENITDSFEYFHIEADAKIKKIRNPRKSSVKPSPLPEASLSSLTTNSSAILNSLLQPGMMDDNLDMVEEERRAHADRMKNIIVVSSPTPKSGRRYSTRMPGTLITPSPTVQSIQSSMADETSDDLERKPTIPMPGAFMTETRPSDNLAIHKCKSESPVSSQFDASQPPFVSSTSTNPKPLMKSMSFEERAIFLDDLVDNSRAPASVFTLPMTEIYSVEQSAVKRRFHCRVADLQNGTGDGWLILGMDKEAVEALHAGIRGGLKKPEPKVSGGGFRAIAGGAVAGAVATWGGLAFS